MPAKYIQNTRSLKSFFWDQSGCIVIRTDANKTILGVPARLNGEYELCIKIYHFSKWYLRLRAMWLGLDARRDMRIARQLQNLGIQTPKPIAALVQPTGLCLHRQSLYAAKWLKQTRTLARLLKDIPRDSNATLRSVRSLIVAVGRFVALLHKKGVRTKDMNPGNLLIQQLKQDNFKLFFIDYEHVRLVKFVPLEMRLKNLAQIGVSLIPVLENYDCALCEGYAQIEKDIDIDKMSAQVSLLSNQLNQVRQNVLNQRFERIGNALRQNRAKEAQ